MTAPAYHTIETAARDAGLGVVGALHPGPEDGAPEGIATLILLGPDGPDMWDAFSAAPEAGDGAEGPMDRWSKRVISTLANDLGGTALFPFGGPPWQPFQRWAAKGEGAVVSPVSMQASPTRGLWASYRGALGFAARLTLPERIVEGPCRDCARPCLTACPVDAFKDGVYDIPACTSWLSANPEAACHEGCLVRQSCPAGKAMDLPPAQRAFHIRAFRWAQR